MAGLYGDRKYGFGNFGEQFGDASTRTYGEGYYGAGDYGPDFGAGPYAQQVLSHPSLVAYYRMGEPAANNLRDSGPNALDGFYGASGVTYGVVGPLVNDPDTAVTLSAAGADPQISIAENSAFDLVDGPLSMECWIKRSATQGALQYLFRKDGSGAYCLQLSFQNRVEIGKLGTGPVAHSSTTITDTTSWHHLVVTKDGSARTIYVDSVDVTALDSNVTLIDTSSGETIGGVSTARFPGSIDEVAVYGAVLTPVEVYDHWVAGHGMDGLLAAATASPTLVLTAPAILSLAMTATASAALAVKAQTAIPLDAASAIASATLAVTARTELPLGGASASTSATLAVTAGTTVAFDAASATSSTTLALTAPATLPLDASECVASTTLALTVPGGRVPLDTCDAVASATLSLTAPTVVALDASQATVSATLAVSGSTFVPLAASSGVSTASLEVTAPTRLSLASSATASATLAVSATTAIPLNASSATASTSLAVQVPVPAELDLASSAASSASLSLKASTTVALGTAAATSTATLSLHAPSIATLSASGAVASTSLALTGPGRLALTSSATASTSLALGVGQVFLLLAPSSPTAEATLAMQVLTGLPFAPVAATAQGTLLVYAPGPPKPLLSSGFLGAATNGHSRGSPGRASLGRASLRR